MSGLCSSQMLLMDLNWKPYSNLGSGKDKGRNSVGTSEDGEENSNVQDDDVESSVIIDMLSSVSSPQVIELLPRSALLSWSALSENEKNSELDISESELGYEVLLADIAKGGKYRSIYNGCSLSCRWVNLNFYFSLIFRKIKIIITN